MKPSSDRQTSSHDSSVDTFLARSASISRFLLLVPVGLALLILVVNALDYRTRADSFSSALFYIGVPLAMLLVLSKVLLARPPARVRATLALISIGAASYVGEAAFTFLDKTRPPDMPTQADAAAAVGAPFDPRPLRDVIQALRRSGEEVFPALNPRVDFVYNPGSTATPILPIGGVSRARTVLCNESGTYVTYLSDRYGFNNPLDRYEEGRARAAIIGDSFTVGTCVSPDRNVAGLLSSEQLPTLNLGMIGNGPLLELATLKEYATLARPPLVFWMYYENDLGDLDAEKTEARLKSYLNHDYGQDLPTHQSEIDEVLKTFLAKSFLDRGQPPKGESLRRKASTRFFDHPVMRFVLMERFRARVGPIRGPNTDLFVQVLLEAKRTTESWGGRLTFVYLPSWQSLSDRRFGNRQQALAARLASQIGLPFVDILETMRASEDPLMFFPFRIPGHYNEMGYQLVAASILSETLAARGRSTDSQIDG